MEAAEDSEVIRGASTNEDENEEKVDPCEGGQQEEVDQGLHTALESDSYVQQEGGESQQPAQEQRVPYQVIERAEQEAFDRFYSQQSLQRSSNEDLEAHLLQQQPPIVNKLMIGLKESNKSFFGWRWCNKCNDLKPPRTHHCSICQCCVMRMDHHCPWTGNCIGLKTHKYFICFLFWTIMACMHVAVTSALMNGTWKIWSRINYDDKFLNDHRPFNPIITPVLAFSVSLGVCVLYCMHMGFIYKNETTVEYGELMMIGNPFRQPDGKQNAAQIMGHLDGPGWFRPELPGKTYIDQKSGEQKENTSYLNGLSYPRVDI